MTSATSPERAPSVHAHLAVDNLSALFFLQAAKLADAPFMYVKLDGGRPVERWVAMSWREAADETRRMGAGLIKLGVQQGDRVAIFAQNCPRWVISDQAIQGSGALGVPVYPTSTDEQLVYILNDSQAIGLIAGDPQHADQVLRVRSRCPALKFIVALCSLEECTGSGVVPYPELLDRGAASESARAEFRDRQGAIDPARSAAVVYTSGTTGVPRGVVLTHRNFMSEIRIILDAPLIKRMIERDIRLISLCHLPFCHVYGRTAEYYAQLAMGGYIYFAESMQTVAEDLKEVRPQMLISVPRLYEKIYEALNRRAETLTGFRQRVFDWSMRMGNTVVDGLSNGRKIPVFAAVKFAIAGALVYNRVRAKAGLDRLVFAGAGGAALSPEINRFLRAMNIQVGEGYGLTETSSAVAWNTPDYREPVPDTPSRRLALDWLVDTLVGMQSAGKNPYGSPVGLMKLIFVANTILPKLVMKPGTVGRPCKGTHIRLADDGEIEVKGPQVFERDKGYFNRPDLTAEAFTPDGYFRTGDIGRFDADGYLTITDRKKDLLVTAGGKNVAPQPIEQRLILDPFIEQACVVGEKRSYIAALIVPCFGRLDEWAAENHVNCQTPAELVARPEVRKFFQRKVDEVNRRLPKHEQVKRFCLLPGPFTEEGEELSPTHKIKRRVICRKFAAEIASCYENNTRRL